MIIGLFALSIAALCGLVSVMGTSHKPEVKPVDYSGIYKSIQIKEI